MIYFNNYNGTEIMAPRFRPQRNIGVILTTSSISNTNYNCQEMLQYYGIRTEIMEHYINHDGIRPNMIPETIVNARRTRITIAQKIEVGHAAARNPNHTVMRQFNISERTVRNIKRSLPSLRRHSTKSTTTLGTKTLHLAHYPKLEAYLPDFLSFARAGKCP